MKLVVSPGKPLQGSLTLAGDKSLSHRAALFAALAQGDSFIDNFLVAGVTQVMLEALTSLMVNWELVGSQLTIHGKGMDGLKPIDEAIHCGNSATTIRLLAGALAAAGVPAVLDGSPGLRGRPMRRIVSPLQVMGVPIRASDGGTAPLFLDARPADLPLRPLDYTLPVASAQVKTCLLLAALAADGPTTLHEPELSRDHTERMLASMGVDIQVGGNRVMLEPPSHRRLDPIQINLPGDISSAAFLMVAATITPGSQIILRDILLNPTRTGLLDALGEMGADIEIQSLREQNGEPVGDVCVSYSDLRGIEVDGALAVRMIDEFPAFAIAAAFAHGRTLVRGATELRHKESDRITGLCRELGALGVAVIEAPDGFSIQGGTRPRGRLVTPSGDHRLAMALAVAGLASDGQLAVQDAEIIAESFPNFAETLRSLGADVRLES